MKKLIEFPDLDVQPLPETAIRTPVPFPTKILIQAPRLRVMVQLRTQTTIIMRGTEAVEMTKIRERVKAKIKTRIEEKTQTQISARILMSLAMP